MPQTGPSLQGETLPGIIGRDPRKGPGRRESSKGRDTAALPHKTMVQHLPAGRVSVHEEDGGLAL